MGQRRTWVVEGNQKPLLIGLWKGEWGRTCSSSPFYCLPLLKVVSNIAFSSSNFLHHLCFHSLEKDRQLIFVFLKACATELPVALVQWLHYMCIVYCVLCCDAVCIKHSHTVAWKQTLIRLRKNEQIFALSARLDYSTKLPLANCSYDYVIVIISSVNRIDFSMTSLFFVNLNNHVVSG